MVPTAIRRVEHGAHRSLRRKRCVVVDHLNNVLRESGLTGSRVRNFVHLLGKAVVIVQQLRRGRGQHVNGIGLFPVRAHNGNRIRRCGQAVLGGIQPHVAERPSRFGIGVNFTQHGVLGVHEKRRASAVADKTRRQQCACRYRACSAHVVSDWRCRGCVPVRFSATMAQSPTGETTWRLLLANLARPKKNI